MPPDIQNAIIKKHNELLKQLAEFPTRMTKLKVGAAAVQLSEEKIKKVLIVSIFSDILKFKGIA